MASVNVDTTSDGAVIQPQDGVPWMEPDGSDDAGAFATKWLVVYAAIFLAVFGTLIYLVYQQVAGENPGETYKPRNRLIAQDGQVPLVRAPGEPFKVRPLDPGGELVADQDKSAFDAADGNETVPETRLADASEAPIARPISRQAAADNDPGTTGIPGVRALSPTEDGAMPPVMRARRRPTPSNSAPPPTPEPTVVLDRPEIAAAQTPAPVIEVPKPSVTPQTAPKAPVTVASADPAPAAGTNNGSTGTGLGNAQSRYLLQLGAFSTRARAQRAWGIFQSNHPDQLRDLGSDLQVTSSTPPLYRVRAAGVNEKSRADRICAELKAEGQPCRVIER
ncbi:MAG: SPOR domain-containing protein [Pseudomonadota bacterium]